MTATPRTRGFAALIALVAFASLAAEYRFEWVEQADAATPASVIWHLARYFTILTNSVAIVLLGFVAVRGRWPGAAWPAAVTVWTGATGIVYHVLLAPTNDATGWEVWSNTGLHTIVPLGLFALWLAAAPKVPLPLAWPAVWIAYPLAYAVYAILRGVADGEYPYFFLDPVASGVPTVIGFVIGLGAYFLISGLALVGLARLRGGGPRKVTT